MLVTDTYARSLFADERRARLAYDARQDPVTTQRPLTPRKSRSIARVLVVAVPFLVAAIFVLPALAAQPQPLRIEMDGVLTGPSSAAGTWSATGLVADTGTYTETFRFAGNTIHGEKVLVGSDGTIVLALRAVVVPVSECVVTFGAGSWTIAGGTGAYASLGGGGQPIAEPGGFGNVCTGAIEITHTGDAHFS